MEQDVKIKKVGNTTKPGNPLWDEYVDSNGNSSLEVHDLVTVWTSCKGKCYYVPIDSNGNIQCKKCGNGQRIVWGLHKLKNGKIIKLSP